MVLVATAAGASAVVRRTGFALVPVMLLMVLMQRHRLKGLQPGLFFVAAIAPFAVLVGAEQAVAPIVHAGQASSLMGRHLFAKAAMIDAPPAAPSGDPLRRALDQHLEHSYAPIRRLLAGAPREVRAVLSIYYETCLQGGCVDQSRALMPDRGESAQTEALGLAGRARLRRAPLEFARLTALHYGSLWTVNRLRHPDTAAALNTFVAAHRPLPFEKEAFSLEPGMPLVFEASPNVRYAQWLMTAIALATGALALLGGAVIVLAHLALLFLVLAFVRVGRGTQLPLDPPRELVVRGLYRFSRNPMYVGVLSLLGAQALYFASPWLALYAALLFCAFHSFVVLYEEPTLTGSFGAAYRHYHATVPRWLPDLRTQPRDDGEATDR
jgi:protein-S-isoprenylcysteine O-methyltransferase Ste14